MRSAGSRSGVNCARRKSSPSAWANERAASVLPRPGKSSSSTWPAGEDRRPAPASARRACRRRPARPRRAPGRRAAVASGTSMAVVCPVTGPRSVAGTASIWPRLIRRGGRASTRSTSLRTEQLDGAGAVGVPVDTVPQREPLVGELTELEGERAGGSPREVRSTGHERVPAPRAGRHGTRRLETSGVVASATTGRRRRPA